jgi:hypothetical protein
VEEYDAMHNAPTPMPKFFGIDMEAVAKAKQEQDKTETGSFWQDLGKKFAGGMKPPGLDDGLYNQANGFVNDAQQQNADDMGRFKQLMNGQGSLGAQQAMAGAQQAATAQRAMANSARGGLYGQAALGQNATNLNNTANLQAMQQANAIREGDKYAGASMFANAANAGRNTSNAQAGAAQNMGLLQGQQNLGYQGIQDNLINHTNKIGAGVDAANAAAQHNASAAETARLIEQQRRIKERELQNKQIFEKGTNTFFKAWGKVMGGAG